MKLRATLFPIAVATLSLLPLVVEGQAAVAEQTASQAVIGPTSLLQARMGVSRAVQRTDTGTEVPARVHKLPYHQSDDTSHSSRTHNVIVGTLVGAAVGIGTGLLLDHTANSGRHASGEQVTYSFEVITIPLGSFIGAVTGLLIPTH